MSEVESLKKFLASIQVNVSDIWLTSCTNWCKQEVLTSSYTQIELQNKVYEQWLLTDLRDIEVSSLPPSLSSKQHFILNGKFCLQMMQVVDISKPKHWQLQKIRNSNILTRGTQQDADVAGTGKRMLQLTLTDGIQEVEAMEYRPIPALSINLTPGVKIRIVGPVTVRRGRVMLEQHNVAVLCGAVEELLVPNAAENVLARFLKVAENPNPQTIQEKLLVVEKEETNEGFSNITKLDPKLVSSGTRNGPVVIEDEDLQINKEIEAMLEVEAEFEHANAIIVDRETPDLFERTHLQNNAFTSTQLRNVDKNDEVFNEIDLDAHLSNLDKVQAICTVKHTTISISKLIEMKDNVNKGNFKIKAKFKSVVEKLNLNDDEYKLIVSVEDASGELVVKIHSDIISEFAGYTPSEIMGLKSDIVSKNEAATAKMLNAIQTIKDKLIALDNVVSVQIEKNQIPVITKLL